MKKGSELESEKLHWLSLRQPCLLLGAGHWVERICQVQAGLPLPFPAPCTYALENI